MIKEYLFGSFNTGKADEIRRMTNERLLIRSCNQIEGLSLVEENGISLEENAF